MSACFNCGADVAEGEGWLCDACATIELNGLGEYTTQADEPAQFEITLKGQSAVAWLIANDADARAFAAQLKAGRQ